jgi:hypothetical protein
MKPGDKVKYLGHTATVIERFWDDGGREWRVVVRIRRGKYSGDWGVREATLNGSD